MDAKNRAFQGKRPRGRPGMRWIDGVTEDLKAMDLKN